MYLSTLQMSACVHIILYITNINTENRESAGSQLCRQWWHRRLSWRQPAVQPVTTRLPSWRLSVFSDLPPGANLLRLHGDAKYLVTTWCIYLHDMSGTRPAPPVMIRECVGAARIFIIDEFQTNYFKVRIMLCTCIHSKYIAKWICS